ncbi:MAG: atpH [Friedmanniella sp.]|nr:atpH [Friedmanniella sp.]
MSVASDARVSELDHVLDGLVEQGSTDRNLLQAVVAKVQGAPTEAHLATLSSDLFAVVDALDSSVALRRALTDPATSPRGRARLAHDLLDGKVSPTAITMVTEAVEVRWGGGRAMTAALERQAVRAQLFTADRAGELEETEDELFRFARLVESNPDLRNALSGRAVDLAARENLVGELLAGKATDSTVVLAKRAVAARERTFDHTIEGFVTLAAAQKSRVVATVRVARPLTGEQRDRLRAVLRRQVGRDVAVQEILDPDVVGGVRVELGDEVIDGTVVSRLRSAHRLFD